MAYQGTPTFLKLLLGNSLRELREASRMEVQEVADALKVSHSKVRRHEGGQNAVSHSDLMMYIQVYGQLLDKEKTDRLHMLRELGARRSNWHGLGPSSEVAPNIRDLAEAEGLAAQVATWQPLVIPGILQTRAYTEELISDTTEPDPPRLAEELVVVREERKARVLRAEDPLRVWAILSEAVVRTRVGGKRPIMREQVQHLLALSDRSHVVLQILPHADAHYGSPAPFMLIDFPTELGMAPVAYAEGIEEMFLTDVNRVASLQERMNRLRSQAMSQHDSREFLHGLLKDL